MARLPRAKVERHLKAFERAGWRIARVTGSHYILTKESVDFHQAATSKKSTRPHDCKPAHFSLKSAMSSNTRSGRTSDSASKARSVTPESTSSERMPVL